MLVGPTDEKPSMVGGETPNAGVLKNAAAPTAMAPFAELWPNTVLSLVLVMLEPKLTLLLKATNRMSAGADPELSPTRIKKVALPVMLNKMTGSAPISEPVREATRFVPAASL